MRVCRRLPENWTEVPARRKAPALKAMLDLPGEAGRLEAVRRAAAIPMNMWRRLQLSDKMALLEHCPWASTEPKPAAVFTTFRHRGKTYHAPADDFTNGTCMEYPMADEHLTAYLESGDRHELLKLTATLYREADADLTAAAARDDFRAVLSSRVEVVERAAALQNLPHTFQMGALLYFLGVKVLVQRMYGSWLFEEPDEEAAVAGGGDPLGWWGLYLDAAKGDVTKLDHIHQSNFHNFCLMEVRRRKQIKEAEMRQKIHKKTP